MNHLETKHALGPDALPLVREYLAQSTNVIAVVVNRQGIVLEHNRGFCMLIARAGDPDGQPLERYLHPDSLPALAALLGGERAEERLRFVGATEGVQNLVVQVFAAADRLLVIGERLMLTQHDLLHQMTIMQGELLDTTRQLQKEKAALERAQHQITRLEGLLPVCSWCKKVRDDAGYWGQLDRYLAEHTDIQLTHGVCPECERRYFRDELDELGGDDPPDDNGGSG